MKKNMKEFIEAATIFFILITIISVVACFITSKTTEHCNCLAIKEK